MTQNHFLFALSQNGSGKSGPAGPILDPYSPNYMKLATIKRLYHQYFGLENE